MARPRTLRRKVRRVCVLTSGGDAPGLNAVVRGLVKHGERLGLELFGSEDGFTGLVEGQLLPLSSTTVRGKLPTGGSVLGCSGRANPFAFPRPDKRGRMRTTDESATARATLANNAIDVLVVIGGDGSQAFAMAFYDTGVPVIGVPKAVDNDLAATDVTFGFDAAISTATWAIDTLHATAEAHHRVMVLEVMGRDAGFIALHAGIAGGADVVLIPEIPYDVERVAAKIRRRKARGSTLSIVVVAEGARPKGKAASKARRGRRRPGGAGLRLEAQLAPLIPEHEVRTTALGHLQRGGAPTAGDRVLGTRLGVRAAELAAKGRVGRLVALRGTSVVDVPLEDALGEGRRVDRAGELAMTARAVGIELGARAPR
ncbi:MAG: ATP-dependent 6-phosphofructokinase [Myxococcota bacterium]